MTDNLHHKVSALASTAAPTVLDKNCAAIGMP